MEALEICKSPAEDSPSTVEELLEVLGVSIKNSNGVYLDFNTVLNAIFEAFQKK